MKKTRIIIFSIIILFCVLAIGIGLYIQFTENDYQKAINKTNDNSLNEDEIIKIKNNFDNIFNNEITGEYNNFEKINNEKEIVYISAKKEEIIPNKYDLNVQIPQININNNEIKKCNSEIIKIFQNKASDILAKNDEYTIYNVKFHVYISNNILSIIIKANLKEGKETERKIIKTYNYDLENEKMLTLEDIIQIKNLDKDYIQSLINNEIKSQKVYEKSLLDLGYETYTRDLNSDMYNVENANSINSHNYLVQKFLLLGEISYNIKKIGYLL